MLKPGERLGDFEILRLLGKGGMGHVYEAKQFHPERLVALKVLAPWLAENKDSLERFEREAHALAKLDHPGIVRIIATGNENGVAYYVMQLIQGISLAVLLQMAKDTDRDSRPPPAPPSTSPGGDTDSLGGTGTQPYAETPVFLPLAPPLTNAYRTDRYATTARIGLKVAQALASAHRLNLVHRDIKPSNIMLDQHDHVYVVDFGLTRCLDSAAATRTGHLVGTPWYMSPEQAAHTTLDCRSDVYSLGVTLYHLATGGQGPYTANRQDTDAVLEQVRGGMLVPVRDVAPDVPPAFAAILTRALALDPARRYPSALELAADLEKYLQGSPISRTVETPAQRFRRYGPLIGAALFALIVTWVVGHLSRDKQEQKEDPLNKEKGALAIQQMGAPFQGRDRRLNVPLRLLRDDQQPDRFQVLMGGETGTIQPIGNELVLRSMSKEKPYLVALDDPGETPFELRVELRPRKEQQNQGGDKHELGVFFGWVSKSPDPRMFPRFFVLTLDTRPVLEDDQGRLSFGTWGFRSNSPETVVPNEQTPKGMLAHHWIALPARDGFHELKLRVEEEKISIALDDQPPLKYTMEEVQKKSPWLKNAHVQFLGAVGIWVRDGLGHFRNATLTALPRKAPAD